MPNNNLYGEAYRNIRLCIDSYHDGVPVGRMFHPGLETGQAGFRSLSQLLVKVERLLDEANFPQAFTAKRFFIAVAEPEAAEAAGELPQRGALATFNIRMMFRQHASWQGGVTWVEGKGEQSFRSALELVLLMDSVLGNMAEQG